MTVEEWLTDERSKTYVADAPDRVRSSLLGAIERLARDRFPVGQMAVRYETRLWIGNRA